MRLKNLVHWILDRMSDVVFEQLSKLTFAETDGVPRAQMLSNIDECRSLKIGRSTPDQR